MWFPAFVLGIVVILVFVVYTIKRILYVVPPNQALIISGTTRKTHGRTVGYRVVTGGRTRRIPLYERVDIIDLRNINIDVEVKGAFSKGGIPLNVQAVANIKLPSTEPMIHNAVERFVDRSQQEIMYVAKETLEGNLRGVLAQLTPEEVNEDKNRFTQILTEEAEHDLSKLGIVLDQLKIQNVTDDVGYLNSVGRIRGAELRRKAVTAEVEAKADAAINKAKNWEAAEVARYAAELAIMQKEMEKRTVDAHGRRDTLIAQANGEVKAEIASVKAEIKRQQARAVQVQRQLEADIVQPADASRMKQEEEARGRAAVIVERGKAEASALHDLIEAYKTGGIAAKDVVTLQNLLPLVDDIAGVRHPLRVDRISVLPDANEASNDSLARRLISAHEQVKAATGIDVSAALGGSRTPQPKAKSRPAPPTPPEQ